jgi:integrase
MGVKIREKKPGEWWVFVNDNRHRASQKAGNYETARKLAEIIEAKLKLKGFEEVVRKEEVRIPTYKEYSTLYLEGEIKPIRKKGTYERYEAAFKNHIFPAIGKKPINQIGRGEIRSFLVKYCAAGHSKRSTTLMRDIMNGPFQVAFEDRVIDLNPVTGALKRLNIKADEKPPIDPLTAEETVLFLDTCRKYYSESYPFFMTLFRTGLRVGEALALQWGDVDWNSRFIKISRSSRRKEIGTTKTGKTRKVDMSEQLWTTLKDLHTKRKREALLDGTGEIKEFIFHNGEGNPSGQNSVRYVLKRVLEKAGLREIRVHDTRHSYASQLLSDGVSPVYVMNQLGHHSIEMTVNIYGHWIPSGNQEIINRLDKLAEKCTQNAPQAHPEKQSGSNSLKLLPLS